MAILCEPTFSEEPEQTPAPDATMTSADATSTIERLFERTHRALWRFALRMCGDVETARDMVQDTYLRALGHALPADERAAELWLYRTLLNRARDLYRSRRVRESDPRAAHAAVAIGRAPDPETVVVSRERLDRLMSFVEPRRRAILLLHELDGRALEWIAATLHIRLSTVRWHLAEAKNELRVALRLERGSPEVEE
jgi:RNA polymerase sigma-70 factor (ECF subfamily)